MATWLHAVHAVTSPGPIRTLLILELFLTPRYVEVRDSATAVQNRTDGKFAAVTNI